MFTKARWSKSFIFNSLRLLREWLEPGELTATALALVTGGTEGPPGGAGDNNGRYVV
jgi:hypothetical protein